MRPYPRWVAGGADSTADNSGWAARTLWTRGQAAPLRAFLRTESGSAGILVGAVAAALLWANVHASSYETIWQTDLSIRLGSHGITQDLRTWVNNGLMAFFFLVVGLEARREFDLGDLRERRRFILPLAAGLIGMVVPVLIYLAFNAGRSSAHGWGIAMSTDTALALGVLALLGKNVPDRARVFLLTVFVVDDLAALLVIALVYSDPIVVMPLVLAVGVFALLHVALRFRVQQRWVFALLGLAIWAALLDSGIDPVVAGLAIGLSASAYTPSRGDLEEATGLVRRFREEPTPEFARLATAGLRSTLSPNARLQTFYHPWTSYVIVPLFALANAGIGLDRDFLGHAYTTPVTLGVLIGYVVGKPVAVVATSWVVTRLSRGRVRPPIGWAAVIGSGTISGIGFTVALLIATRAFHGDRLEEAKLGALSAAVVASVLTWVVYRLTELLPAKSRDKALLGDMTLIQDLIPAVDIERDHIRGPVDGAVDGDRVRRLRVPALRRGRAGRPRAAGRHDDPLRLAAPAAHRRAPAGPARRRGIGGGRRTGRVLADARPVAGPPGRAAAAGPAALCRGARPGPRPVPGRPAPAQARDPGRPGRRVGGPERGVRDAVVLHQRPAALRRLRPGFFVGRRRDGARAAAGHSVTARTR